MHRLPAIVALAMLIVATACSNEVKSKQNGDPVLLAEAAAVPPEGDAFTATGHLKIQMPAGIVGEDRYWIYLNGRIVSAPQRGQQFWGHNTKLPPPAEVWIAALRSQ